MSSLIQFDTTQLEGFQTLCVKSQELAAKAADTTVGYIAAEGRKYATKTEENVFHFGKPQLTGGYYHAKSYGLKLHPRGNMQIRTKYDKGLGGWVSKNNFRDTKYPLRMINFKFTKQAHENLHDKPGSKTIIGLHLQSVSEAEVTSQVKNLWYKSVTYKKNSPWVGSNPFKRWKAKETRDPKTSFGVSEINAGLSSAKRKSEEKIKKTLEDKGWK